MKNTALTKTAFAAAGIFSIGVLAGCDYCQPLLLATVIYLVFAHWPPAAHWATHYENFVS